ncbi:DUF421 domain-containing protein [Alteribacillus sp. HJP-4]|uniref:DUF421 domain-containing protein n=1 Tax=Alteribacillus sp. HJP-4 TaxID=2775394 RepID=UPI0035CD2C97
MEQLMKDGLIVLGRVVTILPLLLFVGIFMGKRAIGELPIFDFLVILTLGSVVGADIANPEIEHLPTAIAIILIALLQKTAARLKTANRKIGRIITFEPTIVVQKGQLLNQNLKAINYSIDNILQMLREKGVFDLKDVETAVVESNGSLSVLKKPQKLEVTAEDLGINVSDSGLAVPVIMEGHTYSKVLHEHGVDEAWLHEQLNALGIKSTQEIFFASINRALDLHVSLKQEGSTKVPLLKH